MKHRILLAALALSAALVTPICRAQEASVYYTGLTLGGTNWVAANSTNFYAAISTNNFYNPNIFGPASPFALGFGCNEFTNCGYAIAFNPIGSGSGNVTFRFIKSYDGGNIWTPVPPLSVTVALNGTSGVSVGGSLDLRDATDFALYSIENPNGVPITNIYWAVNFKSPKYGAKYTIH